MVKKRIIFFTLTFYILCSGLVLAIETGEIRGKVHDENGTALPGVEIQAAAPSLQGVRTVLSSKNGEFHFPLLPVGRYTLTFSLKEFTPVVQENVIVHLGQVTSLRVAMSLSKIEKEIVVIAPTPLIDKTTSDTSYHLSAQDLEKIPSQNRTVVDIVKFAPGVTGVRMNTRRGVSTEGQPSFRGEGEEGNNWIVDGLSISGVRLRNSGVPLNFDSIEEVQVISDPFSPEFGSAYGGIINMVTKSGSDDFKGEFSLIFQDRNLQAARNQQLSVVSQPSYFSNYNWYFNLGGPILKDKLWFFISENYLTDTQETKDSSLSYLFVPGGKKSAGLNNLFTKLTYSLNSNHNISLTTIIVKLLRQTGGTGLPELYQRENLSDFIYRFNYRGILNSSTFIEAGLGQVRRDSSQEPLDKDLGPAQYFINDLAQNIHNSYGNITDNERRLDLSVKLTKSFETETFGRHEISSGLEYYNISSDFGVGFTGKSEDLFPGNGFDSGTKYYFNSWKDGGGTPTFFYEYGDFSFVNSARGLGIFIRDKVSWNRVTVMAGLRSQTQRCLDDKKGTLWSWGFGDFLSPRLSLAWDITGDGVNVLKLGWGRFSDLITTMPLGFFNSGAGLTFRTYRWQGTQNPTDTEIHSPSNWRFENEQKIQGFEVASGIKPNSLSRYLIEFDRQLGPNWALKARYVRSDAEKLLEILTVYDPVTLYKFLYDNFEYKRRHYWGFEFEINGRIGSRFFLNASYSHASANGTNPGQTETGSWSQEEGSTNYLGLFGNHMFIPNVPELSALKAYWDQQLGGLGGRGIGDEGWYGRLPYSVDHDVKINATYLSGWGIAVSAAFEWLSGYYWEKMGYVPFFGGYYSFPEGRGARTTPSHGYLDLSLEKILTIGNALFFKGLAISIRAEVFNVLNSQRPVSYVKEDIPIFGAVWGRQLPRQARISAKIKF